MREAGGEGGNPGSSGAPAGGPAHFGDAGEEYRAARHKVALFDYPGAGVLRLGGPDALDVLHRTTTADLKGLGPGQGSMTVIQTATARILDWLTLWIGEGEIVALTAPDRAEADRVWLDAMIIMDDATVEDTSGETRLLDMIGPEAPRIAGRLGGPEAVTLEPHHHLNFEWEGFAGKIARGRRSIVPVFRILVPATRGDAFLERLVAAGGAVRAGRLAASALRIEAGDPLPGRELTEETNPLDAGLLDSIGLTKGCYPGQEVIARMITYKSVKRALAGILFEADVPAPPFRGSWPVRAAVAESTAAPAGRLTSAAYCYGLARYAGLAIVPLELSRPGTELIVETANGPVAGRAASLPLLP